MKRMIAAALIASIVSLGFAGCTGNKESAKQELKITTPRGTTTITTEKDVKKSDGKPPAAKP